MCPLSSEAEVSDGSVSVSTLNVSLFHKRAQTQKNNWVCGSFCGNRPKQSIGAQPNCQWIF